MRKGKKDLNSSISQIRKRFKLKIPQGKKQKNETLKDKNTSGQSGVASSISSRAGGSGSGPASSQISGDNGEKLASSQTKDVSFNDGLSS